METDGFAEQHDTPVPPVVSDYGFDIVFVDGTFRSADSIPVSSILKGFDDDTLIFKVDL